MGQKYDYNFQTIFVDNQNDQNNSLDDKESEKPLIVNRSPNKDRKFPFNIILYGAPGTGKTYYAMEYALSIVEKKELTFSKDENERKEKVRKYKDYISKGRILFTTFHQNYSYEEFIQGLRPDPNGQGLSFKNEDGVFKKIVSNAVNDTDGNDYVMIIDEINRANISKVFGELITLIEDDKRWGELNESVAFLPSGEPFTVPNNLYIIGTMNSSDKSISLIDAALRRRFDFIEMRPDETLVEDEKVKKIFLSLNKKLVKDLDSTDLLIGHSYFIKKTTKDVEDVFNHKIIPLLYEYYYDNKKKVIAALTEVLPSTEFTIHSEEFGRVRISRNGNSNDN